MTILSKSFCFLLVGSILASVPVASAQNVPRLYTNGASCGVIKAAIRKSGKILLRFKKPRSSRIMYDLFYKSPSSCSNHEEAVSVSVPSSGGMCKVSYRCVPRMDQESEQSNAPVVAAPAVVAAPSSGGGQPP